MKEIDEKRAREILDEALSATGVSSLSSRHAHDYALLGPLFIEIVKRLLPDSIVSLNPESTAVLIERPGDPHAVSLGLTSTMQRLNPYEPSRARAVILEKIMGTPAMFNTVFQPLADGRLSITPQDRNAVYPLVMSKGMMEAAEKPFNRAGDGGPALVSWRLMDRITALATIDRGTAFSHVTAAQLDDLKLNRDEARMIAMRNLKNLYAKEKLRFDYNERMFEVGGMNGLASSLMLLDEFLERQRKKLGDDLVIHVPNRETLLFFRKSDRQLTLNVMSAIISGDIPCLLDEFLFEYDGRLREFSPSGVRRPN